MREKMVEWIKDNGPKQLQTMTKYGAAIAITQHLCAATVPPQITDHIPPNCQTAEISNKGTDVSVKVSGCNSQGISVKSQEASALNNLTEIDLKLENLYKPGEYQIDPQRLSELAQKDPVFQFLAKQNKILYIQGSADKEGNSTFIKSLSNEICGNQGDFNRIQLHASSGNNSYEKQLSSQKIPSPYTNSDLPQLRARSFQCWISSEYPSIKTEILEGGVQPATGSQYRRVRIFIANSSSIEQLTSIPSPD